MVILNATGAVNFSQGDLVMAGGFVAVALAGWLPLPGYLLLPLVLAALAGLGLLVALLGYFPLRRRPPETVFISTIAIGGDAAERRQRCCSGRSRAPRRR